MPLDFKELQGVGITPDLIALTGADANPGSQEGLEEVGARQPHAGVFVSRDVVNFYSWTKTVSSAFIAHDLQAPAGLVW